MYFLYSLGIPPKFYLYTLCFLTTDFLKEKNLGFLERGTKQSPLTTISTASMLPPQRWAKKPDSWRLYSRIQYDLFHGWANKPDSWWAFRMQYDHFHGWAKKPDNRRAFRMKYYCLHGWARKLKSRLMCECF